jgi:sodium-coupled monocarboxylate transporter 8/12
METTDMLSFWDYFVFGITLAVSSAIGIFYYFSGGKQRSNREYLLADSNMNVWVVSVSLMASFMSAITLLGVPAETYSFGVIFFYINISYIIGTPICAFFYLPVFYNLKCTSAYEYLELRFSSTVRTIASLTFMLQMIVYMGIVLYAPALALSAVTGLSKWSSIISVGLVCTFYCGFGGIKAVLWTDFMQSGLMFLALIAVSIMGVIEVGSVTEVYKRAAEGGRINLYNFDIDPTVRHSFWSLAIGGIFIYCSLFGVNQTQVQRLLTVKSLKEAQFAVFVAWPITSFLSLCCIVTGVVMYAYFQGCDPILDPRTDISRPDQMLPYFMMKIMGNIPGLPGLFIAGVFSGSLSSVSSFVNSLAAVTLEDFLKPILKARTISWTEEKETLVTKIIAIFFGIVCLLLTVVAEQMTGILEASLTIFGVVGGPLLGLFTLGMMSKRCSSKAALIAFLISLAVGFWIGFGSINAGIPPTPLPDSVSKCDGHIHGFYRSNSLLSDLGSESSSLVSSSMPASYSVKLPLVSSHQLPHVSSEGSPYQDENYALRDEEDRGDNFLSDTTSTQTSLPRNQNQSNILRLRSSSSRSARLISPQEEKKHQVFFLYKLSYMYLAGFTFLIEIVIGQLLSFSFIFPNEKVIKSNLISPLMTCWSRNTSPADDVVIQYHQSLSSKDSLHLQDVFVQKRRTDQEADQNDDLVSKVTPFPGHESGPNRLNGKRI